MLLGLAACSFSTTIGGGDDDDAPTLTLVDDDLADGVARDGVVVAGRLEPDGFVLGGLHARAFQSALVDSGEDFAKVLADAATATQTGTGYAQLPANWGGARPKGLGLRLDGGFTVIYDGEILLPKGETSLEIDADDRALVEVLGTVAVVAVSSQTITFTAPEAGWYPIRAAISEDAGNARLVMTIVQGPVRTAVDATRLRARVTNAPGLLVYAFDGQGFVGARGHTARPTIDESFGVFAPPYDLTTSSDRFSLRFAGQLRIETQGMYMFSAALGVDTNDSWRLWIDGELVAHRWLGHPVIAVGAVDLAPGWHSILVDYADEAGNAEIEVNMTGPDAPSGGPIDPARLRPVVVFGNTFTFVSNGVTPIVDVDSSFVTLPLAGEPTELIDSVDYAFRVDNQDMSTLQVTLFDCTSQGKTLQINAAPSYHYFPADKTCAGKLTNPVVDWQLRFSDGAAGNNGFIGVGQVREYGLTALYHGGPKMPFAPAVIYTSGARSIAGAKRIATVRAIGSLDGADIAIEVRAAADAASLETTPFELVREGEPLDTVGEVAQYRITITTNGWQFPVLDKVEIDYVVAE
ncbi:MAG: PA14 domain-containing protein [Myxococcota bacterium]|nr:hypothetical protein [Deltaproteobacteria bacterium]MDQ3335017.1 PA14 domain-containing protein [Myxococcota bacterium]